LEKLSPVGTIRYRLGKLVSNEIRKI